MPYLLEMKNITKTFGSVKAIHKRQLAVECWRNRLTLWGKWVW